jgi:HYDIN/CFA65/VesB family protein
MARPSLEYLKTKRFREIRMRTQHRSTPPILRYRTLAAAIATALTPGISAAFLVTDPGDSGPGTLRQALTDANTVDGSNNCVYPNVTITFNGPFTIQPSTALPGLGCNPTVDGGGVVTLDGVDRSISCGLDGRSSNSTVRGLEITRFATALCGNLSVYANKIHDNFTGIEMYSGSIGDGTSALRNYIYSNGIGISINETNGFIYHNYIGTPDGVTLAGNTIGIDLQYTNSDAVSNVISGNGTGVRMHWAGGSKLSSNYIGTDPAGGSALPNTVGVSNECGSVTLEYNTISGNISHGVQSTGSANIYSNYIGTNYGASLPVPNGGAGIMFYYGSSCFATGADVSSNDIAYNDGPGVTVMRGTGIWIEENRIYGNTGKNIDLNNNVGPLPNDPTDADTGPNNQQNYPVINSVLQSGGNTTINFTLDSQPGSYYIEFFHNPADGPPAGQVYTGQYDYVTLSVAGAATFTYTLSGSWDYVSATATLDGSPCCDTSEFSPRVKAAAGPVPSAFLSQTFVDFGNVAVNDTSLDQTVTVRSTGDAPYVIQAIRGGNSCYGGAICYGGSFICETSCEEDTSYPKNATCSITARFAPTSLGHFTTNIRICDNTDRSPRNIVLSGDGVVPPPVSITPSAWDFGSVLVGRESVPQSFTIANPGSSAVAIGAVTATANFLLTNTTCAGSIQPGESCNADVVFTPGQQGPLYGFLQVQSATLDPAMAHLKTAGPTASAALQGLGVAEAQLVLPTNIDMGSYVLGTTPLQRTVVLTNNGNTSLQIASISITAPFTLANGCPSILQPGQSCSLVIGFSTATLGTVNGTLTIVTNSATGSGAIPVIARAVAIPAPELRLSVSNMGFGDRLFNTTSPTQRVTITNVGTSLATFAAIETSNLDFLVSGTTCGATLAPAATCFADVAMRPVGFGPRTGQLVVSSNGTGSPQVVNLVGSGCRPYMGSLNRTGAQNGCAP